MSDTVEKLLSLSPEQIKQLKEEHENFNPDELMTPEELEKQASIAGKLLGVDHGILREMKRATFLQKSYGIKSSRISSEPAMKSPEFIHPDAVSASNSKALVELVGQMLDIQEKILEGSEQDRKAAQKESKRQHFIDLIIILLAAATLVATVAPLVISRFF